MKARGTRGGILLSLEPGDDATGVTAVLDAHAELIQDKVFVEVNERTPYRLLAAIAERVAAAGGELVDVRPPTAIIQARGETVIVARTVRSGGKIDSTGSVVVLGDVNAGAEILANDDIIVVGTLRGLAHAGASGNDKAVIWAERIMSPQLRIGNALAQAGGNDAAGDGPEVAHLKDGAIVIRPWHTN
ncbi:MAG: septum site-determining protein MinC [Trueperaceae bacterium]|nr:septum site-determining protein MinC [Trueperaceae bacterium]